MTHNEQGYGQCINTLTRHNVTELFIWEQDGTQLAHINSPSQGIYLRSLRGGPPVINLGYWGEPRDHCWDSTGMLLVCDYGKISWLSYYRSTQLQGRLK